jgi:ABC-type multidrug transport system ATPase subunit
LPYGVSQIDTVYVMTDTAYGAQTPTLAPPTTLYPGVRASGLGKRYGELWALRDLDLSVPAGSVLGLLGHNGAGKTTTIRLLTTLAQPTTGTATVAGFDVGAHPERVRSRIGVAAQEATVDGLRSGRANLDMIGRLYHLPAPRARARAAELLEMFGLAGVEAIDVNRREATLDDVFLSLTKTEPLHSR